MLAIRTLEIALAILWHLFTGSSFARGEWLARRAALQHPDRQVNGRNGPILLKNSP